MSSLPELLLGSKEPSWGDERERSVMLEAYAYVFILSLTLTFAMAAVVAWFVPWWVTVLMFFVFLIPSMEWQRYCKARGVDTQRLAYTGSSVRRSALTGVFFIACAISMCLGATSQSNLPDESSTLTGGIIGGVVGGLGAMALLWFSARRKNRRLDDADDEL